MKINQSDITFVSSYEKHEEVYEEESLKKWDERGESLVKDRFRDRLELSQDFAKMHNTTDVAHNNSLDMPLDPKLMSIIRALEALTGKKINLSTYRQGGESRGAFTNQVLDKSPREPQRLGWGVDYSYKRIDSKEESLQFSAKGKVTTQEGSTLDFQLFLSMQKSSIHEETLSFKAGDALIDPLVLNFATQTVELSSMKHNFDLNLDGTKDSFSFVGEGSGFLALDKNGDGIINDGSELFGPTLGNGFNELSAFDEDKNNWIDENDAVFDKLLIWTKDTTGQEQLFSLKDKGVGALYLENIATDFTLDDAEGQSAGQLRQSSVYLGENGGIGTLQEVDLKI
jgi:hypothetical protein